MDSWGELLRGQGHTRRPGASLVNGINTIKKCQYHTDAHWARSLNTLWWTQLECALHSDHRRTKEQDWQREPEVHINSLSAILYSRVVQFRKQEKVLMSGFCDGFTYKSLYIVGLFRYTHCIPSGTL